MNGSFLCFFFDQFFVKLLPLPFCVIAECGCFKPVTARKYSRYRPALKFLWKPKIYFGHTYPNSSHCVLYKNFTSTVGQGMAPVSHAHRRHKYYCHTSAKIHIPPARSCGTDAVTDMVAPATRSSATRDNAYPIVGIFLRLSRRIQNYQLDTLGGEEISRTPSDSRRASGCQ